MRILEFKKHWGFRDSKTIIYKHDILKKGNEIMTSYQKFKQLDTDFGDNCGLYRSLNYTYVRKIRCS